MKLIIHKQALKMKLPANIAILILMHNLLSSSGTAQPANGVALAGSSPASPAVLNLAAGPIQLTFADGELRRLYVGDKEIIRRIYVSVRDTRWDTVEPKLTHLDVKKSKDSFAIRLDALCRGKGIDFSWHGEIVGTAAGKITFRVHGAANADCRANRFGMCVLYGAASLAGQAYEVLDPNGKSQTGIFPPLLEKVILHDRFQSLRYRTADGLSVTTSVDGTLFGMEDQRQFGDSSYKAFSAMPFSYPTITRGASGAETISIQVDSALPIAQGHRPVRNNKVTVVRLGGLMPDARLPQLIPYDKVSAKAGFFMDISNARDKVKNAPLLSWPFNAAVNLFDDETLIENLSAVADQVRTARAIAPRAVLRVAPVTFNPPYPRDTRDPRNQGMFAAAWTGAVIKHLTHAGAHEAMLDVGPGYADTVIKMLAGHQGQPVLATAIEPAQHFPFEALAFADHGTTYVFLMNLTPGKRAIRLEGLPAKARLEQQRVTAEASPTAIPPWTQPKSKSGGWELTLSPFEVCQVRVTPAIN